MESRFSARSLGAIAWIAAGIGACSSEPSSPPPSPSSTSSAAPEAPASPLIVVLRSHRPLVFAQITGGLVVADQGQKFIARGVDGGHLGPDAMAEGLPPEGAGHILRMFGRHPDSLWLSFEIAPDKKSPGKHPLFRLDARKKTWKQFADDWRPLLATWSKGRILAASTSSGKLKIKVMEPYAAKGPEDLPNPALDDAECSKSLRVEAMAAFPSGAVWMSGSCKPASAAKRRHVGLFWAAPDKASPAASVSASAAASAAPRVTASATASATAEVAPSASASAAPAGSADMPKSPETTEEDAPKGPPGKVLVLPAGKDHRAWAARAENDVWFLGDGDAAGEAHLHHWDGERFEALKLPEIEGGARLVTQRQAGEVWVAGARALHRQTKEGAWEVVPPPNGALGVVDAPWDFLALYTSPAGAPEKDLWAAAKVALPAGETFVVVRHDRGPMLPISW